MKTISLEEFNQKYSIGIEKTEAIDGILTKFGIDGRINFNPSNTTYKIYVYPIDSDNPILEYEADSYEEIEQIYSEIKDDFLVID